MKICSNKTYWLEVSSMVALVLGIFITAFCIVMKQSAKEREYPTYGSVVETGDTRKIGTVTRVQMIGERKLVTVRLYSSKLDRYYTQDFYEEEVYTIKRNGDL